MGNVTSSLNTGPLQSIADIIKDARADPSAVLGSLNSQGRTLASTISRSLKEASEDPSAVLDSLNIHGRNAVASLSVTAKEIGSGPRVAEFLKVFKKSWHETIAQLPAYQKRILALVSAWWIPFTATIVVLYLFGGFGRAGIRGGSLASGYQSRHYGGYTPRSGFFANSTSESMRGKTPTIYKVAALVVASVTVVAVYKSWT
ncbi:uncharacterized protein LY89DRAFT_681882 [Mollisia scopiformis]|uniref:Uncharacterized protein n=1 Tax=Mollisia scopiformis TaxID=149040 RepID=A0A194XNP0_MOLSC|nr:uncharacterized protein LY89DRAFT_681882 [Mollisia scopiformis]KUJ21347.1 hypothetical protein LY89DRAFT_681882 [Mollisia scopiformis]